LPDKTRKAKRRKAPYKARQKVQAGSIALCPNLLKEKAGKLCAQKKKMKIIP
jgi:hypothetical protein